jgi:hypothetical protein
MARILSRVLVQAGGPVGRGVDFAVVGELAGALDGAGDVGPAEAVFDPARLAPVGPDGLAPEPEPDDVHAVTVISPTAAAARSRVRLTVRPVPSPVDPQVGRVRQAVDA